jgi:PAS domain S-box-containing protein
VKLDRLKQKRRSPGVDIPFRNSRHRAVIATDLKGKVLFWNSAAEQVYGWKWDEAIGQLISELIVPEPEKGDAARIMQRLRQGKNWTGKFRLRRRDGTEFVASVTDKPIRDSEGNLIGIMGISTASGLPESLTSAHPNGRRRGIRRSGRTRSKAV